MDKQPLKEHPVEPIKLNNLIMYGELAMRSNLNLARLEREKYWPETIFGMDQNSWPADWEGRTMLALTLLAQSTGTTPAFLDDILERIPEHLNEKGYLGPIHPEGVTHEQAMSGHSWMCRALVEYHNWKKQAEPEQAEKARAILNKIVESLYIPQTGNYRNYPIDEATRYDDPNWILSHNEDPNLSELHSQSEEKTLDGTSDVGCAFIALDGATAAYELLGIPELKELIEAMIGSFATLPRERLHVQTHATLSGIRGILRFHRITGEPRYLDLVIETFELYKSRAWTEHYANYNWFGLPRWTEPCAIIDSFIISQELWAATGEEGYLRDAHHIFYNAIAHAQRSNGGFGTDLCTGANGEPFVKPLTYEVFWCCNMRGGDGLARAAMYSFYTEGNSVILPYFHSCKAELELANGTLKLREQADYPFSGKVELKVQENSSGKTTLKFFAPEAWTSGAASEVLLNGDEQAITYANGFVCVEVELNAGDRMVFDTEIALRTSDGTKCINNSREHFSFRYGPMLLGIRSELENPEAVRILRDATLTPIGSGRYSTQTTEGRPVILQPMWGKENLAGSQEVFQVLFKK